MAASRPPSSSDSASDSVSDSAWDSPSDPAADLPQIPATPGLDLVDLQTFIAVARSLSFSAAAAQLHVTQPTVTGRIHRLEALLGVQLLRRTTRKVEPTPAGGLLLREAVKTLVGLTTLVDRFRKEARRARQRVIVAATPTIAALRLPPLIQAYSERYPDVEVELLDLKYSGVLAAIDTGEADVAVLALDAADRRYRFTALWKDDMVLVAPKKHPLARNTSVGPEDLASVPLIVVDQYHPVREKIAAALRERGLTMPPSKVVGNLNTLLGMLDAGMGVTLLPRSVSCRGNVGKHARIEIRDIDMTRNFGIITARDSKPNSTLQSFIRFLRQADIHAGSSD
ncbi:LysR family transcriptional regulator [Variovorax sp. KK3]|uniref:LysR family transcriptional regulator n=1 Tax=Variovorax sp. KK3 TaxID=1855728 RepID=UPI0015C355A9|nr:LysR family transcriptional regulator [Variovorax sp. KK3]